MAAVKENKLVSIGLVILLGVCLQVVLGFADTRDTPNKAAVEFMKAYVGHDEDGMKDRLCEENMTVDDMDTVETYLDTVDQERKQRGFGKFYTREFLYHVNTHTISKDTMSAELRLTGTAKGPLRHFFSGDFRDIDIKLKLVKENGKWKVCNNPLSICGV